MKEDLKGKIAICNRGLLGVIAGYDEQDRLWYGYHIEKSPGSAWESRNPEIVGSLEELHRVHDRRLGVRAKDVDQLSLRFNEKP